MEGLATKLRNILLFVLGFLLFPFFTVNGEIIGQGILIIAQHWESPIMYAAFSLAIIAFAIAAGIIASRS